MATKAWGKGADWVVLLGDDVGVECSCHYRAIYRSFLDITEHLNLDSEFGFGCPSWNDTTFKGFPNFPCVGKAHFEIFGSLIPQDRHSDFINQDLDLYLNRLYLPFKAAPCVVEARLSNGSGSHVGSSEARYDRIPMKGWQDFIMEDIEPIRRYLPDGMAEAIMVDVVVPSYRVQMDYLLSICSLEVPEFMQTLFIVIIDNPETLVFSAAAIAERDQAQGNITLEQSERILEDYLSRSGNAVRVRCNKTNLGAFLSRNHGLDESAADFILNLDDDLVPNPDLLEQYGRKLQEIDSSVVGLIGLV